MTTYVPPQLKRDRAREFLLDYFSDKPGGAWRHDVMAAAPDDIGERTIQKVAVALGVEKTFGGQAGMIWKLPPQKKKRA